MKNYSSNAVDRTALETSIGNVDKKQTEQIIKLRKVVAVAFGLNLAFSIALLVAILRM